MPAHRPDADAQESIHVRTRFFRANKRRPVDGIYYGLFFGLKMIGTWKATEADAREAEAQIRAAMKPCLCCGKHILSQGPHHRMCGRCRSISTGMD